MNNLKRYTRTLFCSVGFLVTAFVAGCGGGGDQGRDPILGLPGAELVTVTVAPQGPAIAIGAGQQFTATASYSDNTSRDVTAVAAWTSASATVATVNATTGLAKGVAAGTSVITATFGGKAGSSTLTVTQPQPVLLQSLTIVPTSATVQVGASLPLAVTANYSNGTSVVVTSIAQYVSGTTASVTVAPGGVATAVAPGASVITASFGGKSVTSTITVPAGVTLSSIAVTPASATVGINGTQQFVATGTYSDGSSGNVSNTVTWTSGTPAIATVAAGGLATGVTAGNSNIVATLGANSGSAVLTVTAAIVPPVTVNLGRATGFAVLAGTSLTNNSGGTTVISGDIGSPSQTTDPVQSSGTNYKAGPEMDGAFADLQVAITDANSRTCTVSSASGVDLGGLVLTPGVYCYAGAISITGNFTMNGAGVYIFRTASTLNSTANSTVSLINGATADKVFWVPVGATTLGANSTFKGSILGKSAAITLGDNATVLNGRVLSAAAVTLSNNQVTKP
jgi:Ice-binding-like/Bacterial Ig-like domain (group 2)